MRLTNGFGPKDMTYTTENERNVKFNHINVQVFQLLEDLDTGGNITMPRGFACKGGNLATLEIDPFYPIMDFPNRKFNYRYFAGELAWYLQKTNDISFINNFSSFFSEIKFPSIFFSGSS